MQKHPKTQRFASCFAGFGAPIRLQHAEGPSIGLVRGDSRHKGDAVAFFFLQGADMELALRYLSAEPDSLFYTDRIFRRYVSRSLRQ